VRYDITEFVEDSVLFAGHTSLLYPPVWDPTLPPQASLLIMNQILLGVGAALSSTALPNDFPQTDYSFSLPDARVT